MSTKIQKTYFLTWLTISLYKSFILLKKLNAIIASNMIPNFKKKLDQLLEECREESYQYFDKNIRPLPKNESGEFIITRKYFYDNDVDAFRHAYTSGVFTQEFFSAFANVLGVVNEMMGNNTLQAQNMDLWNNFIGRKNGKKTESRTVLAELLKKALENDNILL